jgi:hypothetical protein
MSGLYDVIEIENQIEKAAADNDGEIPDTLMQALIEAQMKNIVTITNLCKYIKSIDYFSEACKAEEARIAELRKRAEKRKEAIYKYITPVVARDGKIMAGTFQLSTRKSESVEIDEGADITGYKIIKQVETPDKTAIKNALKKGAVIHGARLIEHDNLQIK